MELVEGDGSIGDVESFVDRTRTIAAEFDVTVQSFDARYIVDRTHLERAVELADRAFERDDAIARNRSVEILLYAAGRRQINRAMTIGIGDDSPGIITLIHDFTGDGEAKAAREAIEELLEPAGTLDGYDTSLVRDFYDISGRELEATDGSIVDLVHERVALLTIEK